MTNENRRANIADEVARGDEALAAAKDNRDRHRATAVNQAYYAAFHYGVALCLMGGEEPSTFTADGWLP